MIYQRIDALMRACGLEDRRFPTTILFNENWLMRIVLDWFDSFRSDDLRGHELFFTSGARWFSEAFLSSAFLHKPLNPRTLSVGRADNPTESWTHADGVIGHFEVGRVGKADLFLSNDAEINQFDVLEGKILSRLSPGVANDRKYDQAVRNVACIAEVFRTASVRPETVGRLSFYVLAPQKQIKRGIFDTEMDKRSMAGKVQNRVARYNGERDQWFRDWFEPTLKHISIGQLSWESVIEAICEHDSSAGPAIRDFYGRCLAETPLASEA